MADSLTDWAARGLRVVQAVEEDPVADLAALAEVEAVLAEAGEAGAEVEEEAGVVEAAREIRTGEARSTANSPISEIDAGPSSRPTRAQSSLRLRIPR